MKPDSLEAHGVRVRLGELVGADVPWWDEADLTPDQRAELDVWLDEHLAARPQDGRDRALWGLMEHNGVRHTHVRGKPIVPQRPAMGFECRLCGGHIVAKDPGDFPFVGGPAHGRWIVTGGVPRFRVPVPQPVTVVSADAAPDLTMHIAEYQRDGDRYVFLG